MKKDLLKMLDLSREEIFEILNLADQMKYDLRSGKKHRVLEGKTLGMIFQKSSTRTRVSFEAGMYQLGGHALFLSSNDLQIGRGEPIEDTARVMARYLDGVMIRTFAQKEVEDLARWADIPVINGLTDFSHPCQVLADLMTVRERLGELEGVKLCYIGDGNNMCNSLVVGGLTMGMTVSIATPEGFDPAPEVLSFAKKYGGAFLKTRDPGEAAQDARVVATDVWASMGQEGERQVRQKAFAGVYQVNEALMARCAPDAFVLHCLPAHRGEEITADVFEKNAGSIFDEAENRLHAQKAVMALLMGG